MKKYSTYIFTFLFALVAIIYNSWPLGYLLDNTTARFGLPSDLEDPNHPYSWVFIVGDIITALILMALSLYIARRISTAKLRAAWAFLCIGIFMFGFFTGFGAAAPDQCHGRFSLCVNILNSTLSLDGLETGIAAFGLLMAFISSAILSKGLSSYYRLATWGLLASWFSVGMLLVQRADDNLNIHSVEQLFLVLGGVGLVIIGLNIDQHRLHKKHS